MKERKTFSENFAEALRISAKRRNWRAFVPFVLIASLGLGAAVSWNFPNAFWLESSWSVSATVYVGFVTFNALLLAFSQNSLSKIQEIASGGVIGRTLAHNDLLDETLFAIEFNQLVLATSSAVSAFGLISVILPLNLFADKIIAAVAIGLSLYALLKSFLVTREMNAFVWEQAYAELSAEARPPLAAVPAPPQREPKRPE